MSTRTELSDEDWKLLVDAPRCAAMGVVMADFSVVSFAKEVATIYRFAHEVQFPDSLLIQDVLAELRSMEPPSSEQSPDEAARGVDGLLARVGRAVVVLDGAVAAAQAEQFKDFVYAFADQVARAGREGLLGLGPRVSDKEADFLRRLKEALWGAPGAEDGG